jgi:hypothetical protein
VIPEGPFLFAIGGMSLSLAGLAGLVATLRRDSSGEFSPLDRFRLREIVEFSFANTLIALSLVPLSSSLGSTQDAVRVLAGIAIVYLVMTVAVLLRRQLARGIPIQRGWAVFIAAVNVLIAVAAVIALFSGTVSAFEWLLVLLLARPMIAFVVVLASFERPRRGPLADEETARPAD